VQVADRIFDGWLVNGIHSGRLKPLCFPQKGF
jgi:hypothetical protein